MHYSFTFLNPRTQHTFTTAIFAESYEQAFLGARVQCDLDKLCIVY